jgi:hypothetical protein
LSPWLYLVLAHVLADFVLQPYELVKLKQQPIGLWIHSAIHGLLAAAVMAPLSPRWWLAGVCVGALHYPIDYAKVSIGYHAGLASLVAFLVDQAVHLAVLVVGVPLAGLPLRGEIEMGSGAVSAVFYYAVPYATATFAAAIVLYQLAVAYGTRSNAGDLLTPIARIAGYAERGLVLTLVLFAAPVLWWAGAAWYALRFGTARGDHRRWVEIGAGLVMTVALGLLFRQG